MAVPAAQISCLQLATNSVALPSEYLSKVHRLVRDYPASSEPPVIGLLSERSRVSAGRFWFGRRSGFK